MKKDVKDVAAEAGKAVAKVAADVKEAAPRAAKKASATTTKAAKSVSKTAKEAAEKVETAKKAVAKKAPVKKTAVKETVYLQYLGKEIDKDALTKQVKEIWTKQMKKKVSELKSITLYLKPEENTAYYVINDEITGSIEL